MEVQKSEKKQQKWRTGEKKQHCVSWCCTVMVCVHNCELDNNLTKLSHQLRVQAQLHLLYTFQTQT